MKQRNCTLFIGLITVRCSNYMRHNVDIAKFVPFLNRIKGCRGGCWLGLIVPARSRRHSPYGSFDSFWLVPTLCRRVVTNCRALCPTSLHTTGWRAVYAIPLSSARLVLPSYTYVSMRIYVCLCICLPCCARFFAQGSILFLSWFGSVPSFTIWHPVTSSAMSMYSTF